MLSRHGLYGRHNTIRNTFGSILSEYKVEYALGVPLPGVRDRPADLFVPEFAPSSNLAIDVSVVHPLPPSLPLATVSAGASAAKREQCKTTQSSASCADAGWSFCPVDAEATGAWEPSAQKLVRRKARFENMRSGTHVHELSSFIWRQLSFALVGQVGKQLHRVSLPAAIPTGVPVHIRSASVAAPSVLLEEGAGMI